MSQRVETRIFELGRYLVQLVVDGIPVNGLVGRHTMQ